MAVLELIGVSGTKYNLIFTPKTLPLKPLLRFTPSPKGIKTQTANSPTTLFISAKPAIFQRVSMITIENNVLTARIGIAYAYTKTAMKPPGLKRKVTLLKAANLTAIGSR